MRVITSYKKDNYIVLIERYANGNLKLSSGSADDRLDRISCRWNNLSIWGETGALEDYLKWCFSGTQYQEVLAILSTALKEDWDKNHDDRLNEWKI